MLPEILACNYCNVRFCEIHGRFIATCRKCRTDGCGPCRVFNIQVDALMRTSGEHRKKYIFNFVFDFLNISNETLKQFYNSEKKQEINLSAWKMHEEHGRKNYTSTLSSTMKYQYQMKKEKDMYF